MPNRPVLRFGIQSLDRLIGTVGSDPKDPLYGIDISVPEISKSGKDKAALPITSSVCLAGPDGTGKSVISLHLASRYLADCLDGASIESACPDLKVLYISTDLTYKMALKGWYDFGLNQPLQRREPLVELKEGRKAEARNQFEIGLRQYFPSVSGDSKQSVTQYLESYSHNNGSTHFKPEVCFVDLASRTAGDDWGFVHRLLSTLTEPGHSDPRHLVILDAVEGFETLVGDLNAFGEESSRRSRIAQVMRLASGRCHLLLVVEESHQQRFPEEFVTDVVVRLRNVPSGRYLRRTVEVEKARGQWHRRGQHPYVIRSGIGSTTGEQINADDPQVFRPGSKTKHQGYVHVFQSLDDISRDVMIDRLDPIRRPNKARFAAFGLPYLDNMLGGTGEKADRDKEQFDTRGLPCSSATALIGDSLTQKSQLGKAFLSRTFYSFAEDLRREIEARLEKGLRAQIGRITAAVGRNRKRAAKLLEELKADTKERVWQIGEQLSEQPNKVYPVAVLFTTHDLTVQALADDFYQWLRDEDVIKGYCVSESSREQSRQLKQDIEELVELQKSGKSRRAKYKDLQKQVCQRLVAIAIEPTLKVHIEEHTICRRFEIHDLPGPVLMSIFQCGIERAQQIMFRADVNQTALPEGLDRFNPSWRIRVMVDDLNTFRNTYPDMREDPLMLPSLLFMFGREGVTSLIVDTQSSGSPELSITERFDSSVRELVQTRIYIWRLPFYGENRVAISVIPPISHEYRGMIRELRWETKIENRTDRALTVDPHFELYTGIERGQPQPVSLEVRLYCDTQSVARYIENEEKLLREIFTPVLKKNHEPSVIVPAMLNDYEPLRDACHVQRDTRLEHTTILEVNEFWWLKRLRQRRAGAFRPQWNYLSSATALPRGDKYESDSVVDPFWVFQPIPGETLDPANDADAVSPVDPKPEVKRKLDFFDDRCGYNYGILKGPDEKKYNIDRVPYTWDFGFLLCNGRAWDEAAQHTKADPVARRGGLVDRVWTRLRKASGKNRSGYVSWRDFLAASKIVAEFESYRTSKQATAFDFTMSIPESFSCLMLEMWFSEAYDSLRNYENLKRRKKGITVSLTERRKRLESVGQRRWALGPENKVSLLKGLYKELGDKLQTIIVERREDDRNITSYSLELYKVWLLLTEAVNFKGLVDSSSHLEFEFKSKDVSADAVSARHSYKTASSFIDSLTPEQVEQNWVPVRLPGHFSVRADWFLAVAGGSRSSRLADHALDLLSSQRANISRLQEGIGLPTRTIFDETDEHSLRTRLISAQKGKPLENIKYDDLRRIGASSLVSRAEREEFFWLWRSGIWGYNRHSRIWHKWLNRALLWWHSLRQRYGSNWTNGFDVYDDLTDLEFNLSRKITETSGGPDLQSWKTFHDLRDILIAELDQVTISRE